MGKSIIAIIAGLVMGFIVIYLIEWAGHSMNPPPADMDWSDKDALTEYVKTLPASAFLMVILAYALGSFAGGYLASRLAPKSKVRHGLIVGGALLVAGLVNLISIPHPVWFTIVSLLVYIPFAYLGGKMGARGIPVV